MSDELVFYTNPMSRGRTVRWMLEEVGQPYRTEILDYATTMKAPEYLAINPMGKVPAVKHGDTVITECAAICAYLADAFPAAGLAPPHADPGRGPYYRWLFFGAGPWRRPGPIRQWASSYHPTSSVWPAMAALHWCSIRWRARYREHPISPVTASLPPICTSAHSLASACSSE